MHSLKGAIPRAYRDHRTAEGAAYGRYCRAFAARFGGTVPVDARPTLGEAGRLVVQLGRLNGQLDRAEARGRRRDASRLRRQLTVARSHFVLFERRLEERLDGHRPARSVDDLVQALAPQNRGGAR